MELILILALTNVEIIDVCVDENNVPITCPPDTVCVQEVDGKKVVVPCPPYCFENGKEVDCIGD